MAGTPALSSPGPPPRRRRRLLLLVLAALLAMAWAAAIVVPPRQPAPPPSPARPDNVFVDLAGLVSEQFARDTSIRLYAIRLLEGVVYIDRAAPSGALQPWTVQTATVWSIGTEREDRGIVLFVFSEPRIARVEVGYGLEGELPDARVRQLLETHLVPAFARGRYEDGIAAFIDGTYTALGGEAAWTRHVQAAAEQPRIGWLEVWDLAWRNGPALLPAVQREWMQAGTWARINMSLFALPVVLAGLVGLAALANALLRLLALPGKLRAGAPVQSWKLGQILGGPLLALLCLAVIVLACLLAPDTFTRQGRFGGGGVEVTWPAPPR